MTLSIFQIFDELVELFQARARMAPTAEIPEIKPAVSDETFPGRILDDQHLQIALHPERLAMLRNPIKSQHAERGSPISYVAPWFDAQVIKEGTIDWIFSQAVMEHVDDLSFVYSACNNWLRPGGIMSHQIDFDHMARRRPGTGTVPILTEPGNWFEGRARI